MDDRFHIVLHRRPEGDLATRPIEFHDKIYQSLLLDARALDRPLSTTFDQALQRLSSLPRMLIEPDGSFVWSSSSHDYPWQLDGELLDSGRHLQYVELRGDCTAEAFERLAELIGGQSDDLIVQLVREGVFIDLQEFRRMLEP